MSYNMNPLHAFVTEGMLKRTQPLGGNFKSSKIRAVSLAWKYSTKLHRNLVNRECTAAFLAYKSLHDVFMLTRYTG
jgi:hypothetical protein